MTMINNLKIAAHLAAITKAKEQLNLLYKSDERTGNNSKWTADALIAQIKDHRTAIKTLEASQQQ